MSHRSQGYCRVTIIEGEITETASATLCSPYAACTFSTGATEQVMSTVARSKTSNPKWGKTFEFQAYEERDVLVVHVYDQDKPFHNPEHDQKHVLVGKCTAQVGETQGGHSGDLWLPLVANDNCVGRVHIKWLYAVSQANNLLATATMAHIVTSGPVEEFEIAKLNHNIFRLSSHLYNVMTPVWYWMETCMWTSPLETCFWVLFLYCNVFVFETTFRSMLPGLGLVGMLRSYYNKRRMMASSADTIATEFPPEEISFIDATKRKIKEVKTSVTSTVTSVKDQKATLLAVQTWCGWLSDHFDYAADVYLWRDYSAALTFTKILTAWTASLLFLPIPSFRYFFFFLMMYMYTMYPAMYNFPVLYARYCPGELAAILMRSFARVRDNERVKKVVGGLMKGGGGAPTAGAAVFSDISPETVMTYAQFLKLQEARGTVRGGVIGRRSSLELGPKEHTLGKLAVTVVGITNVDKSSDRYVTVKIRETEFKTKTSKTTLMQASSITYNECFTFQEMYESKADVRFELWEYSLLGKDKFIGRATYPCSALVRDHLADEKLEFMNAKGKFSGTLECKLCAQGFGIGAPKVVGVGAIKGKTAIFELGTLRVCVERGWDLKAMDPSGMSDPYLELKVGDQIRRTRTIKSTLNPEWNETFWFENVTAGHVLSIHMYDWDAIGNNDYMGAAIVLMSSLPVGEATKKSLPILQEMKQYGNVAVALYLENKSAVAMGAPRAVATLSAPQMPSPQQIVSSSPPKVQQPAKVTFSTPVKVSILVQQASLTTKDGVPEPTGLYVRIRVGTFKFKTHPVTAHPPMWQEKLAMDGVVSSTPLEAELWGSEKVMLATVSVPSLDQCLSGTKGNPREVVLEMVCSGQPVLTAKLKLTFVVL